MLAACLAMAPSRGGRSRDAVRAAKSAPVWQVAEREWDHKAVQPAAKATGGRSRGSQRQGFYNELRAYAEHYLPLLQSEWDGEQQLLREQLEEWPRARLAREGLLVCRTGLETRTSRPQAHACYSRVRASPRTAVTPRGQGGR